MKKYVKIALLVIVALIFIGTFVFLYQKSQPKASVYTILNAEITDLKKTTVATGKIEPRDEILIKPQISGIIDEVYKEAGQKIKKGEVIAKVKVIPELGQLNSAESRVRLAEINARQGETDFARMKKLFESTLLSSEEYEKSEVAVKQAREELQTAKDNLEIVKEGITKNKASFSSRTGQLHRRCPEGTCRRRARIVGRQPAGFRPRVPDPRRFVDQPVERPDHHHRRREP